MKATLEFTMPEDRVEHALSVRGPGFAFALTNLDNTLRNALKHGHDFPSSNAMPHAKNWRGHRPSWLRSSPAANRSWGWAHRLATLDETPTSGVNHSEAPTCPEIPEGASA